MSKRQIDLIVNSLLWLSLCLMAATGCLLTYRLPPGSRGGAGLTVWGWSRHDWADLHMWNGYLFLVLIILHLALHWRWLWHVAGGRVKVMFLAGLIGGALAVAAVWLIPVHHDSALEHGRLGQGQRGHNDQAASPERTLTDHGDRQ